MKINILTIISVLIGLFITFSASAKKDEELRYECKTDENNLVFCLDENNKPLTGKRTLRTSSGLYSSIENFKNGRLNGLSTYFNSSGDKQERVYFKDGLRNGMYKYYYANRTIKILTNYKDGLLDGKLDVYYPDGSLVGRMTYKGGKLLRGFCQKDNKKQVFTIEMIQSYPENKINDCGI